MVYLESEECFPFSGEEVVQCEETDVQDSGCAKLILQSTVTSLPNGRFFQQLPCGGTHHPLPPLCWIPQGTSPPSSRSPPSSPSSVPLRSIPALLPLLLPPASSAAAVAVAGSSARELAPSGSSEPPGSSSIFLLFILWMQSFFLKKSQIKKITEVLLFFGCNFFTLSFFCFGCKNILPKFFLF